MSERRERVLWLSEDQILSVFAGLSRREAGQVACIWLPRLTPLPEGTEIVSVHHDWQRRGFGFKISHPSFDVVPPGQYAPDHNGPMYVEAIPLRVLQLTDDCSPVPSHIREQ